MRMARVVETCRLDDGVVVKRLAHYKCQACGARFFDDQAVHAIRAKRARKGALREILANVPDRPPVEGDEL